MRAGPIIFTVGLAIGAPASAQSVREARVAAGQARETIAPVRLASVDAAAPGAPQAEAAAKRAPVKPRVTTCRCGDPHASAEIAER